MSVTILVTVRNCKGTMRKCIESLLHQNYRNYKIYVTDGFSTDGTWEIIKSFGKKIKSEQIRGNPPKSFNYMFKKVNTEFIALTNGDCVADRNWLRELMKPFANKNVVAVSGNVRNPPKPETELQDVVGLELEDRYKSFGKGITRAADMSLALRSHVLKKEKYDERLDVSYDADFGFRLSKYGKFAYAPKAIVYHYHRATWKNYFNQQMKYAKFLPLMYLKNPSKVKGDNVSRFRMIVQPFIAGFAVVFLLLGMFCSSFVYLSGLLIDILLIIYLFDAVRLSRNIRELFYLMFLFAVRTTAWCIGSVIGLLKLL